ncbi:hypothetical protein BT63DRAFT_455442 [Microthyrium microscopicum]|uniref:Uncharacterized protein n=1 Tax=Microthyrium microscopicum TaxID=703497 RepID=A0A6A6UBB3_9PEZI|nr:hypothetical protein BT63DRAFT_455442 [Microthyrium microscopicum]
MLWLRILQEECGKPMLYKEICPYSLQSSCFDHITTFPYLEKTKTNTAHHRETEPMAFNSTPSGAYAPLNMERVGSFQDATPAASSAYSSAYSQPTPTRVPGLASLGRDIVYWDRVSTQGEDESISTERATQDGASDRHVYTNSREQIHQVFGFEPEEEEEEDGEDGFLGMPSIDSVLGTFPATSSSVTAPTHSSGASLHVRPLAIRRRHAISPIALTESSPPLRPQPVISTNGISNGCQTGFGKCSNSSEASPTPAPQPGSSSKLSDKAIISIACVGGAILVTGIVGVVFCCMQKRAYKHQSKMTDKILDKIARPENNSAPDK